MIETIRKATINMTIIPVLCGNTFNGSSIVSQIYCCDMMSIEKHIKVPIGFCWSNGNPLTFKSLTNSKLFIFKAYKAFDHKLCECYPRVHIHHQEVARETCAYSSYTRGTVFAYSKIHGAFAYYTPLLQIIKNLLTTRYRPIQAVSYSFSLQSPMKSFIFAHGLRMAGPTMPHR